MKLLGLTGGIGAGKTTASQWLRHHDVAIIDTDIIARDVVQPGQPALAEIAARFGAGMLDEKGHLCRDALASVVFGNAEARQELEAILHPRIRAIWQAKVAEHRAADKKATAVVIPLLFETGATGFDATLCLACSAKTQAKRLAARGWSTQQIQQRVAAQYPIEKKMALADFVIWTEGTMESLEGQLERVLSTVLDAPRRSAN